MGGWLAGWLEQLGIKLISTQVVVEVEVGVELDNILQYLARQPSAYAAIPRGEFTC